ncbi:ParA family protein [Pedobacter jeongneungensis]|uniref:ParA family protein n=1 Tax=Pedobacter jeongneungensis TaxID=947309 RepID=UPI000ABF8D89|nr:ParA family protein [Pedobacter jeongneungensis]
MASAKGGSGKTVLTSTFASFLCALGKKVLMVDTDASTNGLTLMYLKEVMVQAELARSEKREPKGSFEISILKNYAEIVSLESGIDLIPSTFSFQNTEECEIAKFREGLKQILRDHSGNYDFIFLDAQAGSDSFAGFCMKRGVSDQVIIVSEYDPLSAAGIERLKGIFRDDLTYDRTWVLLNKMLPDFVQSFSDFLEVAKYLSPIPWDAEVVKSYARRRLALNLESGNEFTLAIIQTLRSFIGIEIEDEVNNWLNSRSALLREPIEIQYDDANREMKLLFKIIKSEERKQIRKRWLTLSMFLSAAFSLFFVIWNVTDDGMTRSFFKQKINNEQLLLVLLGIVTVFIPFILRDFIIPKTSIEDENTKDRLRRLQDRLEKLDSLRRANVDVLIKYNIKNSIIN